VAPMVLLGWRKPRVRAFHPTVDARKEDAIMNAAVRRRVSISFLAVVTIPACSGAPSIPPTGPSPQVVAPPVPSTRTVTGSVWLYSPTAPQPLAGVDVGIWLEQPRRGGRRDP
jgi:hypothetical protein